MTAPVMDKGKAPAKNGKAALPLRPFVAGTRRVDRATYDETKTMTTSTQDLKVYECDPNGFLGGAYVIVEAAAAGNAATVAYQANGPTSAIDTITFNDVNNKNVIGPFTGHDLSIAMKYGGYSFQDDPKLSPSYSVTSGAGATAGSFSFTLRLPVEIVHRDALGSLTNKSASATYDIAIRLAPSTAVYSTAPTTLPSVRVRIQQFGWMDPNAADMRGNPVAQNPPGAQTTQYWSKQTYTINSGAFNIRLIGIDSLVRNLVFILVDSNGSRTQGDSDFPDPFTMNYETSVPIQRIKKIWQHMIGEQYGYTGTVETAGGRDYGVYPEPYCLDMGLKPGAETRFGYLPVSSATNISLNGSIGGTGTHTLIVLVNKIVPAGGDPMVLTGA